MMNKNVGFVSPSIAWDSQNLAFVHLKKTKQNKSFTSCE